MWSLTKRLLYVALWLNLLATNLVILVCWWYGIGIQR